MSTLESLKSNLFQTISRQQASLVHGGGPIVVRTYDVNPDGSLSGPTPDVINVPDQPTPQQPTDQIA